MLGGVGVDRRCCYTDVLYGDALACDADTADDNGVCSLRSQDITKESLRVAQVLEA